MSLFRQAAWRKHPMLQVTWSKALIGLPTGVAMFVAVKGAEAVGLLSWDANDDVEKYAWQSEVNPAPEWRAYGMAPKSAGHGSGHGHGH